MATRIAEVFSSGQKALVTYVVAGDPDMASSQKILSDLAQSGADIIELGMPFTDPVADGPVIQAGALRALKSGATIRTTLQMVTDFRQTNVKTPIVLMGYYNPIFSYGVEKFTTDAAQAGVDGLLIVDLPTEEEDELVIPAKAAGIDFIRLVTPTTDENRLPHILKNASGFIYYVSVAGITGSVGAGTETLKPRVDLIKKHTGLPVCVGFGIKTPEDVKAVSKVADGAVVGSVIVDLIAQNKSGEITAFVKSLSF